MKNENNYGIQNLIDISRFNYYYLKLLRVTAYVIHFVNNLKQNVKKQSLNLQFLQPIDIENAELEWIRIAQKEFSSNKFYFNQFLCHRFESKPNRYPPIASLPPYCSQQSLPFETTGVDYVGPVLVKPIFNDIDSNYFYKSQIVLFIFAVSSGVHLEIVPNLSASSFICALKRFISRRGIPNLIISDNGACFTNEEVRLSKELTRMNISWKFIVAASPW